MKKFLSLILITLTLGVVSSCSEKEAEITNDNVQNTVSNVDFINNELTTLRKDSEFDVESVKKALISFDQTVITAQRLGLTDQSKIGELFTENASKAGLEVANKEEFQAIVYEHGFGVSTNEYKIPTELLNIIASFIDTAKADTIDEYISNIYNFRGLVKESRIDSVAKVSLLSSASLLLITAKLIKKYPPKWLKDGDVNQKWVKQLKCAFASITEGLSGSLTGCIEGAAMLRPIGEIFGGKSLAIGAIVGCSVGGIVKGILTLSIKAKSCASYTDGDDNGKND